MLFILTGDIRTGKTTWLEARMRELEAAGDPVYGVLAPGVWRNGDKVGIENVLLPSHERVLLATPAEDGCSTGLGWDFDADALARVNAHLAELAAASGNMRGGLLVIDEIGPLELRCSGGLTAAFELLDAGPTPAWPHALVVVRSALAEDARTRFAQSWRSGELLFPDESGARRLHEALP
ncbi:nucleoside-triphosphatase [Olsenella sp. An290]|uniref:nucleoside-triphosphatase n=1 Tax=Olsenella sp. An290 TaxID=1965625 RepID=UPI001302B9A0|nr:nucleoside-triphosphatase [Olsenella sp. An290]